MSEFTVVPRGDKAINERYRPMRFSEIIGNEDIKKGLTKWMENGDKRMKALFLSGSSSCGKTTTARVLAMGLNCEKGDTVEPCLECPSCRAMMEGNALNVKELNMAELNRKDDVEDIVHQMYQKALMGRNQVFILDECLYYMARIECRLNGVEDRIPIGTIVKNRLPVEVLSLNPETKQLEYKKVINWFCNKKKPVHEYHFNTVGETEADCWPEKIICTENHCVFTIEGEEKMIGELKPGEKIRGLTRIKKNNVKNYVQTVLEFVDRSEEEFQNSYSNVYDLEIEDNHNYFANGVNVHNCQLVTVSAQNQLLKVVENPPKGLYIIFCTTEPDKIITPLKNRCSRYTYHLPTNSDISQILKDVTRLENIKMTDDQKREFFEHVKGMAYRDILSALEQFQAGVTDIATIGTDPEKAYFFQLASDIIYKGNFEKYLEVLNSGKNLDFEGLRRIMRTLAGKEIEKAGLKNAARATTYCEILEVLDNKPMFNADPRPTFASMVFQICALIKA